MSNIRQFFVGKLRMLPFGEDFLQSRRSKRLSQRFFALKNELVKLPIIHSGVETLDEGDVPYVVLKNQITLFGRWPNQLERDLYALWKDDLSSMITDATIRVAIDAVLRYLYPHSMPYLIMPYSREQRSCFHPQHIETIDDLPQVSYEEKAYLKEVFPPKPGDTFLDIGAYMGYGAIRMSKAVGPSGKVIAVEADPNSGQLLDYNVQHNQLTNITTVHKAIWNEDCAILNLKRSGRQANSLVEDIISTSDSVPIETITIDTLLGEHTDGCADIISITINGAEVEAIQGMRQTLARCKHFRLAMAGWYTRDGKRICDIVSPTLRQAGLQISIGEKGGLLAWK